MIECTSCHTLNPDSEKACLACSMPLGGPAPRASADQPVTPVPAAPAPPPSTVRCSAGHPIDPSWKSCPYCDLLQASADPRSQGSPQRSTRLEGTIPGLLSPTPESRRTRLEGEPAVTEPVPAALPPGPRPTRLEEPFQPAGSRRTVFQDAYPAVAPVEAPPQATASARPASPAPSAAADTRRLVAVLAAPDLGPGGTVFAVRAGKNAIGADRGGDIVIASDSEISREHAVILHRNGAFHLSDRLSTNGTWLNGREVPTNGTVALRDHDRIRCGKTELVFLMIGAEKANETTDTAVEAQA